MGISSSVILMEAQGTEKEGTVMSPSTLACLVLAISLEWDNNLVYR